MRSILHKVMTPDLANVLLKTLGFIMPFVRLP